MWFSVYLFVLALVLALLEIQIEGPHGWAEKLPCWRPDPDSFLEKAFSKLIGKPLTGYHISVFTLVFITLHFPFFTGTKWSISEELWTISILLLYSVFWDFLWFVWNPYYGLKKFSSSAIWWHKNWLGPVPVDYLNGTGASFLLSIIGGRSREWGITVTVFLALTFLNCVISQFLRKKRV